MRRIIILLALFSTVFDAGRTQTREEFEAAIIEMNSQMPISFGPTGEAQSVAIEGQYVVYDVMLNDMGKTIGKNAMTQSQYKDNLLTFIPITVTKDSFLYDFFNSIAQFEEGILFRMTSEVTGHSYSISFSADELLKAINAKPDYNKALDYTVMNLKASIPITTYGMTFIDCELRNGYLVSTLIVDESLMSVDAIKDNAIQIKKQIRDMITSETDLSLNLNLYYCCMADHGFSYDYVGSSSNKHVLISFSAEELIEILNSIPE